jgi:hypothetical protein
MRLRIIDGTYVQIAAAHPCRADGVHSDSRTFSPASPRGQLTKGPANTNKTRDERPPERTIRQRCHDRQGRPFPSSEPQAIDGTVTRGGYSRLRRREIGRVANGMVNPGGSKNGIEQRRAQPRGFRGCARHVVRKVVRMYQLPKDIQEPASVDAARARIVELRSDVARLNQRLDEAPVEGQDGYDPEWEGRARAALRQIAREIGHLRNWVHSRRLQDGRGVGADQLGLALKVASKAYGRLTEVLVAAEQLLAADEQDEDDEVIDACFAALKDAVVKARTLLGYAEGEPRPLDVDS